MQETIKGIIGFLFFLLVCVVVLVMTVNELRKTQAYFKEYEETQKNERECRIKECVAFVQCCEQKSGGNAGKIEDLPFAEKSRE